MPNTSFFTRTRLGDIANSVYGNIPLRLCVIEALGGVADMLNEESSHEEIIKRESVFSPRLTNTWTVPGSFDVVDDRWEMPELIYNLSASVAQLDFIQLFLLVGGSANAPKQFTASAVNIAANEITVPQHGLSTGDKVIITASGTLPSPLTSTTYIALVVDSNKFKLSSQASTEIDLVNAGTGAFYLRYANGVIDRIINNLSAGASPVPILETIPVGAQKTYRVVLGLQG